MLSKDSAEEIADGKTPGPMTEINFWEAKCINLESLFEQVCRLNIKLFRIKTDLLLDALQYCNKDGQHPLPHGLRLLPRLQVHVQERGGGDEGGPGHHHAPQAPHISLRGGYINICHYNITINASIKCFCQNLEVQEFTDIRPFFPPLMHLVCLVYSHSAYYNTAARIIILLQVRKKGKYSGSNP